jgi:hypothetical protein
MIKKSESLIRFFINGINLILVLNLVACVESSGPKRSVSSKSSLKQLNPTNPGTNGVGPTTPGFGTSTVTSTVTGVELRHLVDPQDGGYATKVTIPKNFSGYLYVSGLNVSNLTDKFISVRFRFGQAMEPITIPAVIARGPGIIPQTDIEVLILDLKDKPFEKIRLLYDLYDYNNYGQNFSNKEPVSNNRDRNLYCRGLDLNYDPTFQASSTNPNCSGVNSVCKYAYAKVLDKGLIQASNNNIPIIPSNIQVALGATGVYTADSNSQKLSKCLSNDGTPPNDILSSIAFNSTFSFDSQNYIFKGPYRALNQSLWQISGDAITGNFNGQRFGLFESTFLAGNADTGKKSLLFPLYGKLPLRKTLEYRGSTAPNGSKLVLPGLIVDGTSEWMDGCNVRVANYDSFTNEGIGSCNVTSTIELVYTDSSGKEVVIEDDNSKKVKLQLVRPSLVNAIGQDVLYTSLRTCTNSNGCGGDECCYNQRCWGRDLVSQCLEDSQNEGNFPVGENCSSDYQCSSLCCQATTGRCGVHDSTLNPAVLCQKAAGETCVSKEWCRKEPVVDCYVVLTGTDVQGKPTCALKCFNVLKFGECKSGVCTPPEPGQIADFNAAEPDPYKRCENAKPIGDYTSSGSGGSTGSGSTAN